MKRILIITCFLFLFVIPQTHALDPQVERLSKTALPQLQEPPIQIKTLPNGIKVYYLQDKELPIVNLTTYFKFGRAYETSEKKGITSFFMTALRTGGTKTRNSYKLDEELAFIAASISASVTKELSSLQARFLQKDTELALDIYFDLIKNPAFEEDRIAIIKKNKLSAIKRRNEEAIAIAFREFGQSLFGNNSPYAWKYTAETISKINQKELIKYYQDNVAPNQMLIAATSPYDFETFLNHIQPHVIDWKQQLLDKKKPIAIKKEWAPSFEFIQKEGNQSAIVMGHFSAKRFNKDKFKLILADEILGASTFGSRLGNRLRTELGLVYSIRSLFSLDTDYSTFDMTTSTKSESTLQTIDEIKGILTRMVKQKDISEKELKAARERIINRLVFALENPFKSVLQRLKYDYYGYPPNYVALYQKEIEKVTLKDINEVIDQYFFPDKLKIMVVGDRSKIIGLDKVKGLKELPLDWE